MIWRERRRESSRVAAADSSEEKREEAWHSATNCQRHFSSKLCLYEDLFVEFYLTFLCTLQNRSCFLSIDLFICGWVRGFSINMWTEVVVVCIVEYTENWR